MEKIELLEKLVEIQEMHIHLMNDYRILQYSYNDLEEIKNRKLTILNAQIEYQDQKIVALNAENAELKQQYEELQKSLVSVEEN